ncbi:MAG: TonB-dependent receptor [Sphingobacteriaceae bacterium]|jgi:hypothetical protein|nr:TonB-dependent receptor [Sphingobacteriaceae bacterium]
MKSRFAAFACILLSAAILTAFSADDDPLKAILSKLEKFRAGYPQEKVHLHFDKPSYAVGDTIWFKAYVVDAEMHQLSGMSKVLYVDLINDKDSISQSLRLPVAAGLAWGNIQLADTLQEGNYRIRAYTNYMRNFGDEYFFDKTIAVGDALSIVSTVSYKYEPTASAQKVNAVINYSDTQGRVLSGKEVTYNVQLDSKTAAKGKAITDANGNIQISFLNNQPLALKSGKVNTSLRIDDQHSFHKSFPVKSTSNAVDIQFFPEGGNQVMGIRSKVAFKALGADGLGKNVTGYVSNAAGEKVVNFKSEHAGMGFFTMQPLAGQSYTATIKFEDGSEKHYPLPKAQAEGFVLSAGNSDSTNLLIRIGASPAMLAAGGEVTLVAQNNSVVKFVSKNKLDNAAFSANIPKDRFPTGILQLTLFNQQSQPVAERLVFINHNDFLKVAVTGPQTSETRKKVKMDLDVKAPDGKPVLGSLSVSVTDASKVPVDVNNETTILSNLLLTSDIKGYVEQPNYYFNAIDEQKIRSLDNLMLTQGWRRFTWKNILTDNLPQLTYKVEDGITISGRVTQNKKPVAAGKVTLLSSKGGLFALDTLTDANGRFAFNNLVFPDSTRFTIQARTAKENKLVDIELDRVSSPLISKNKNAGDVEINVNSKLSTYLQNSRSQNEELLRNGMLGKTIVLSEVQVEGRAQGRGEKTVEGSANLARRADVVITADQLENCIDLLDCLQGKVAGLIIQDSMPFLMRTMATSLSSRTPLAIILDGVRMMEPTALGDINPQDVQAIEILRGATASVYGVLGGGGVIVVTTKSGKGGTYILPDAPGVVTYSTKAYNKSREFYSPNYDAPKKNTTLTDFRTTVYWRPNVAVKNGRASFEFYNADGKGPYRVTIEGIDANGNLARYVYNYDVN